MKIKELISEDIGVGDTGAGSIAAGPAGNLFAVPMKRNMPRKRPKKEHSELSTGRKNSNVLEQNLK